MTAGLVFAVAGWWLVFFLPMFAWWCWRYRHDEIRGWLNEQRDDLGAVDEAETGGWPA
jgi:MFS-type transporter involved in bile tolerance (Atg22 family)